MSGWDVSDADMPNIPWSQRADVPELPDGALEALLTGDLVTDEACAGLQPAAALLAALNAAPHDGELAGHARVLAEFRHRGGRPVHARRSARRRSRLLTVLLTAKAAAAAAAAAVALGGVAAAAYTSTLPAPVQQFAHSVIGAPSPQPSHRPGTPQATPARTNPARMPSARTPPARPGSGCAPPTPTRRRMARHPRRRWRSATWRRQPAARPRSPPTAQRCPTRAARSPASRPRPQPTRPAAPPHTPPGSHRRSPPPTRTGRPLLRAHHALDPAG